MPKPEAFVYTNKNVTKSHANYQSMRDAQNAAKNAGYILLESFTADQRSPDAFLHMISLARRQHVAAVFTPSVDQIDNLSALREICAVVALDTGLTLPRLKPLGTGHAVTATAHSEYHSVAGLRRFQDGRVLNPV